METTQTHGFELKKLLPLVYFNYLVIMSCYIPNIKIVTLLWH